MATEIDIPESLLLKEVKTEEKAFSSESLEEKVRELVDNKVKHLETSNLVTEPVNTKLETGIMTNESETFFQAPSVPTVTADELSKTLETSTDTPKQEDQEEMNVTKSEALIDEKPVDDVVEAVLTQTEREVKTIGNEDKNDGQAIQIDEETQETEQALNTLEKDQVADSKEMFKEFVKEDISDDAQEASEQCENGPNEEREQKPEESVKNIVLSNPEFKQVEKTEEFPGVEIVEDVKQNGMLREEKGEEATQSNDGQKEKSENPLIAEIREENSSEKIEYKSSTPTTTINKDEAEEKEQDVNVLEKDQGKDEVTSIQDMMPEGGLEEMKQQGDCNEAEVKAKESMEKETEETIFSVGKPENIKPQSLNNVIPTDSSITVHKKPEETMQNEEHNDVEGIDTEDGETKVYGSSIVKEICEEPVSDKANTEEGLRPSESSNKESIEDDVVSKDEGPEKNDVECSQDEPSTGDLDVKTNETITNDENATEYEASDETGTENAQSEVGLKVSGNMEPTKVEILSTLEKNQGDTDGVISSEDATCEDIKETESGENESTVADTEELNETPKEFNEEAEGKYIDSKASYHSVNKAEEKLEEIPDESLNENERKEETEDIRPSAVLEEKAIQVETWEHEEKVEAEATHSDDGQTEKSENPAVTKVCEDNSSEKVGSESSSMMLNEQVISFLTKDEDEEKEQEVTVVKKDQGEESVTSTQDVPFEGCLEETNHDSEGIEPEVVNAKESVEEDIGEIKSSAETLDKKEQTVNPTDVSITTQTKEEEETIGNEEKNEEKAMKSDYGELKESESPIVSVICEETVSHNTESVEGLKVSDTSSTATNEHEIASKDEAGAQVQDREEDDVTFSQENKENIVDEEKNVEDAIEKEPCEDLGPKNVESEVGLKVSGSMEPSVQEAFSTEEKDDQGDTNCVPRSQDATCVDVKETMPTMVGDFKELSKTPREVIKEETENKTVDAQETREDFENKAEYKLLERSDESVKEIEKEVETKEIRPSLEVEEKLEKSELLQGVTTDASISTQTESQDEIAEPDNKDEEEASQSDDGQKEKYDNSSINEVCEEHSSEKVESESSSVKLNEIETSIVNKDENKEKEQEVIVLEKDQGEDGVTSAQNVPSEGCLEQADHDREFIEPEVVDAKGSIEDATEEVRSSVKTPEDGTPETEVKNDGEAIKSDDGQVGIIVNEICEETVLHNTESDEGPTEFDTSSKETNEHKLASKDETEEKNQDQEEDDVTVSQSATSLEDLKVENNDSTIKEEAIEKEACEDMGTENTESGVSLKTSDNIEPSVKALSTEEKELGDTHGVPSSQDATCEDTETTPTTVSDSKELTETTREFIKEETEDKTNVVQEGNDDCEDKAEEKLVEHPDESFKEVEQEEETEENRPCFPIEEKLEQIELSHGVTTDASISAQTIADDGQKEKYDNSSINEVSEEISSEKVASEISVINVNEKETSFLNNDGDDEKEQEVTVSEKDQGEEGDRRAKDVPSGACLEETSHDIEGIESEAKNLQGSVENDTKEIRSGLETLEEGAAEKKEKDDEEAIKSEESQTKESGIPIVDEIFEETVSHNTESEEEITVSDTTSKETNEHELASKDETEEKNQDQEGDDVTVSQPATSLEDLKVENNDIKIKEEAIEKDACEDMGTNNVESGVSPKTSDNIEPSRKEAPSTAEKELGDTDGFPSSQDATCEDTETTSTIVSDSKELNETTIEFIKEETEEQTSDVQEANNDCEDKAEEKLVEQPVESFKEVEQEEETEENRPSVQMEEKLEQNELSHDVTTDASTLTQTKSQEEINEPEEKGVQQEEEGVTSAEDVPSEACLEETSHGNEGIVSEAKNAQGSVEDDTKEIKSSIETLELGATENKEKDDEEAIKSEESQTKESGIPTVDEIFEENITHNTESEEGLKVSDISSKETNEHELVSKDEAEEQEQDQEKDDVTCSHDTTSIEDLQENKTESTTKEDKNDEVTLEKEASEQTNEENAESEVGLKHSDDTEPSKKEALDTIEKYQGNADGVTSSQDAIIVDEFKELNEEERTREFSKEETEDSLTDTQEATKKCENGAHENIEEKPEESVKKIEPEEEKTEATNSLVEVEEKNELLCDVTSDDSSISIQTKPQAEILERQEKNEEVATQSDDSQNEKSEKPSITEVCEEEKSEINYETSTPITVINKDEDQEHDQAVNMLEKDEREDDVTSSQNATPTDVCISTQTILEKESTENEEKSDEEVLESDDSQTMKSGSPVDKEICEEIVSEKETKDEDQELDISEKCQSGGEDVKSLQIAANEDINETTIAQYVATVANYEEPPALSAIPKGGPKEETEDKLIDDQKAREYEDREMPEKIVNDISSKTEQEEYIEEINPSVETNEEKDVCISTPTEAHEEATQIEGKDLHNTVPEEVIDLSNSSDVNQNEKDISILSKDEVHEKEQELNISEQVKGKDEVTCSKDPAAVSEEKLQGKYEDEDTEQKFVETREIPKEYNEVIQTRGETEEKMEQQIESKQEITQKEVCEETVKVVCEEATSDKVEPVEALEPSDSSEKTTEIEEKNDDIENADAIRSYDESKEELKESTGESATTVTYIEEEQDLSTMTKEILEEEAVDKSVDAQQASKESENGGKDEREQQPEESVNTQVDSCTNIVEENIKEGESDSGKKEEVDIEKQNIEAGEADGVKECETIGGTQELSPENNDEVTGDVSKSTEGISQDVESWYDKEESPLADKTDDETLKKKEDHYTETEKMLSELENSKEENVEKVPACSTETRSEKTEDEITEKIDDSSHESIKENECTTKEEECVVDGRTREIEISTPEHEPIEKQIGGVDEVSKDKSTDLQETAEEEPQEDITPSSFIETSTVDTSNSDNKKAENEDSPIEDVDSVSEVQTPEVVPESKDSKLKEECVNTTTRSYVEETKEIVTEEISSDEKTEQPVDIKKESVEEVCEENSTEKTETDVCSSAETKPNEDTVKDEEKNDELGQPEVEIVEEILEKKEDDTTKEKEDSFHDSTEDTVLDKSTRDIEPQEDITLSSSSEILTTHTSNSEMVNSECENLPTEELKSVSELQIAEVEPKTEESDLKEECIISAAETHVDAEQVTVTKEISSDQILEPYGEKKLTHESKTDDHSEETILQQEETDIVSEKNQSVYEKGDLDEEVAEANQLDSAEDCSERVKDVVLTKELSYSDPKPDGNHEETKVIVDGQIGQEDIPAAKDISCESTLEDDNLDKAPKEEEIPSIEGAATIETQVVSTNLESTACPSESETTPTRSLESVSKVIEGSEDSKVKENHFMLATVEHTDVTSVEEEKIVSNCMSGASGTKEDDNVKQAHLKSEEEKSSDLTTEKKSSTEEVDAECQTESRDIQDIEDLSSLSKASYTIEERVTEETENTPNLDLEKEEKDNELISEVLSTPEALPKMKIKGEHPEATNKKCETLAGGELSEKLLDAVKEIDTKEDIEVIAKTEESNQDTVASEVKEQSDEAPLKDAQKDFDDTTKVTIVDVVNAECLNVEPQHLNTEEATLPSVNHENQTEQKKEADKYIDAAIYSEDVKSSDVELQSDMDVPVPNCTSTRKLEVRSADLEVPSSIDAKDEQINLGSTCDQGKTTEEVSGIKQEPLELDATVSTVATKDLDISHKGVTGDVIKGGKLSDVKSESADPTKEEIANSGVKTDEENEEQEDNEDNENSGVMVEASKDMEVKVHKKSHNILSGVGSKVKHSIAKVKKAITGGKSSSPKSPSPKERD